MATIVDGNKMAAEILADLRFRIKDLRFRPKLVVFLVGDDPASKSYVKIKQRKAGEAGIEVDVKKYPSNADGKDLIFEIEKTNHKDDVNGIIIQLPLPAHLNKEKILNTVKPELDVDCLTLQNKEKLFKGENVPFKPPAAVAILAISDFYKIDLKKGNILLIGSGDLVGKPLSSMLLKQGVSFRLANRHTENLKELLAEADIIITGVGKSNLIRGDMIKENAVLIDAGMSGSETGEITGDAEFESVSKKARLISPVPGGVGPVTVAMLLSNVVKSAFNRI